MWYVYQEGLDKLNTAALESISIVNEKPSCVSHIRKEPDRRRSGSNFICSSSGFRHSKAGIFPAIQDVF